MQLPQPALLMGPTMHPVVAKFIDHEYREEGRPEGQVGQDIYRSCRGCHAQYWVDDFDPPPITGAPIDPSKEMGVVEVYVDPEPEEDEDSH